MAEIDSPFSLWIIHYFTFIFSFPVYTIAFLVLFLKCPSYFEKYRNYLVVHIVSGILLEIHIGIFWKLVYPLPFPALCSTGPTANHSPLNFLIFVYLLVYTAISALSVLIYRMKAATPYVENHKKLAEIPIILRYIFYVGVTTAVGFSILIYPYLRDQKEYKLGLEQKLRKFPAFVMSESCIFMQFDTIVFILFYGFGYFSVFIAFLSAILAVVFTLKSLNSKTMRLSKKTVQIQKDVMYSLVAALIVHVILLIGPLGTFFLSNIFIINTPVYASILVLMIQEHGACSRLTLILTNKLLRKGFREEWAGDSSLASDLHGS
ncbi:unnamed protein product [Caenorhabditis brenneri]